MTDRERPFHPEAWKAQERIADRFAVGGKRPPGGFSSPEAFQELASALRRDARSAALLDVPTVDMDDMLAGLALVDEARWETNFHMDINEMELLSTLHAAGVEWAEIGRRLGYPADTAARMAAARWRRLRTRHPNNAAVIDKELRDRAAKDSEVSG